MDIVLDVGGGATVTASARSVRHGGRVICIGFLGGVTPKLPIGELILNNASVHGVTVGNRADFEALYLFLNSTPLQPVIDNVFKLR
ncbi:zinc-binding dehydrogenase [Parasphingorhabdus flavimaris]|uniref:zinc-binding dehydrogenase n=1 Tax=Parasphingorhabdus flavimaris TaxID=266812 RepID=UPI0030039801